MQMFRKSLIRNLGAMVLLVECVVLTALGLFYTERFFTEVDGYLEHNIRLPGDLMNRQLLRYESIADPGVMNELVGEEFIDGMVIGADGRVYYAYNSDYVGQSVFDIPEVGTDLLSNVNTEQKLIFRPDEDSIVSITPLFAFEGAKPFFHVYIKASRIHVRQQKRRIAGLFIFGSVACIILSSIAIIGYSRRQVTKPLNQLKQSADALRRGEQRNMPLLDREDEIGSLSASFTAMNEAIQSNIEDLEEANAAIGKREQRLAAFIEAMPDLVIVLDSNGRYEDIYATEDAKLFMTVDNLKGKLMHEVMPKESADTFLKVVHDCMETGEVQTLEYELPVTAGTLWFEARVSRIGDQSEIQGSVWIVRDITYRKQMEDRLTRAKDDAERVSQRLRELDQTKSTLVSSVSHELRTPLTSLLGFSKIILKNFANNFWPLAKGDPKLLTKGAQIVENLNILIHEGNRLTRLINDVLDLNKIEMGYTEWRDEAITPVELVHKATKSATGQFNDNPMLSLVTQLEDNLPDIVVDIDRMHQVLLNLLTNAAKFTMKGTVTISAHRTNIDTIRFEVADTGPGIAKHEQERIFDVFHQAGDTGPADDKPRGAGLGLAISREIVEHYNGTIWVESELGHGARFIIEFPIH